MARRSRWLPLLLMLLWSFPGTALAAFSRVCLPTAAR